MSNKPKDTILKITVSFIGMLTISVTLFIYIYIFIKGKKVISPIFLTDVPKGVPLGTAGGIFPAIVGSLMSGMISTIIGGVVGISSAIYLSFYNKKSVVGKMISSSILGLSGTPSILFGLVTYFLLIYKFGFQKSIFCASVAVAMMIVPFVSIRAKKIFDENSKEYMLSSIVLGISKEYTVFRLIIPHTALELLSTLALGMAYGMGATAPILYTGAVMNADIPEKLSDPFMSLPYHLYMLVNNGFSLDYAFGTALVLMTMLLLIQMVTKLLYFLRRK